MLPYPLNSALLIFLGQLGWWWGGGGSTGGFGLIYATMTQQD